MMKNRRTSDYWARAAADCWRAASAQFPVLLLTGPRQVGKTTLLRHLSTANRRDSINPAAMQFLRCVADLHGVACPP